MSISLKNHEDRISELERQLGAGGGIVESGKGNPGFVKYANGLIINFGYLPGVWYTSVKFPKPFTTTPTVLKTGNATYVAGYHERTNAFHVTNTEFIIGYSENPGNFIMNWIAIGY